MNPFSSLRLIPFLAFLLLINFGFKPFEGQSDFEEFENNSNTSSILYISPSGSNVSGNGTESSPWQTLAFAVGQASSGDTVFLLSGTYVINSKINIPPGISLKGAGESSVITSTSITANETPIIDMRSSSLIDGDQSISFLKFDGANLTATMAIWAQRRNNIKIHDCTFINFRDTGVWWEGDFAGWTSNIPPTNYTTGNEFFNNEVHNCAGHWGGIEGHGEGGLNIGGQEGMLIYNNVFTQVGRPDGENGYPLKMYLKGGWVKGLKIFNNHFEKTDHTYWPFAIEGFRHFGIEIYNNRIIGTLDLNFIYKGDYEYGAYIHGNVMGPDEINSDRWIGMYLEHSTDEVIITRNRIKNCKVGISFTPRSGNVISNYNINYNIFENLGAGSTDNWYGAIWVGQGVDPTSYSVENFNLYNNVFHTLTTGTERVYFGLEFGGSPSKNINVKNNIFINFAAAWLRINPAGAVDNLNIENNVINNIGWGNNPSFVNGTPSNYVNQNNIFSNPLFIGNGNFKLQSNSPAINSGLNVGLTSDFEGNPVPVNGLPDIGAFEFGSTGAFLINTNSNPNAGGTTSGGGSFNNGQSATVTATAASGYTFTNWTENGSVVSNNASYTFTVTQNRNLTANFSPGSFIISLSASPSAGGSVTGAGNYINGQSATVTASPAYGYNFNNWTENGIVVSNNASYTFTVTKNRNLTANFSTNAYTIGLSSNPVAGGTTSGGGNFGHGQSATVTASPASGYTFTNWTENGIVVSNNASYTFTVTKNRTLTANFSSNTNTISLSSNPAAGGTTSGGGNFGHGQSVTVTASPASGYNFNNWTENGSVVSNNASYTFTVTQSRNLIANFSPISFVISLSPSPSAGGSVTGAGNYINGQSATVNASPASGYNFTNWTENGGVVSNNASYTFTVNKNRNLTANFSTNSYTIGLNSNPVAGGTTSGGGNYGHGQSATVTASPASAYTFTNWTENGSVVSANASYTFTVTKNRNLTANFSTNSFTIGLNSNPVAGGTTSGGGNYSHGQSATVAASPASGYTFTNWTENGSVVSNNASYTFTVTQNRNLTAGFLLNSYTLIYLTEENGFIEGKELQYVSYGANGEPVYATPYQGYHFVRWCNQSTNNPLQDINVNQNITRTAFFEKNVYTLSYKSDENGSIMGATEQFVEHGESGSTVEAIPFLGYRFVAWSDGYKSNSRTDKNVSGDFQVFASFEPELTLEESNDKQDIKVYPIPTKSVLNVDVLLPETFDVFIIDSGGIFIANLPVAKQGSNIYNVSWLSPGVYYLNLHSSKTKIIKKFIKAR